MKRKKGGVWPRMRKLFNDVHLWLGLAGGIVIFVICLSGAIYTFSTEIQEILEPELYKIGDRSIPDKGLSPHALIDIVEEESKSEAVSLTIPHSKQRLYQVAVKNPEGKGRPVSYQINPYSGEIKGIAGKGKGSGFFLTMFKLHRWLLLDQSIGRPIVGISTIMFAFGCITGIVIWFPRKIKHWRQGLKIKASGNWKRTNHDLHNSLGFYAFIFLLVMALTGLCWSFTWYKDGLSSVLGAEVFAGRNEKALPSEQGEGESIGIAQAISVANGQLSYPGDLRIGLPEDPTASFVITKTKTGFFASSAVDKIQIDQYSGKVLKLDLFGQKSFAEKIAASVKSLHMGDIFGLFSKIIYFLTCLIATSLPVTGTLIWWNKLKKKNRKKKKKPSLSVRPVKRASVALTEVS